VAAMMPAVLAMVPALRIAASLFAVRGCSSLALLTRSALSPTRQGQHDHCENCQSETLHVNSLIVLRGLFCEPLFLAIYFFLPSPAITLLLGKSFAII
jgi:hypothetical protein